MTVSLTQDNPGDQNCFIIKSLDLGHKHTIHRLCLTEYIDTDDFKNRAERILENEKQKMYLSGKSWNPGVWVLANKFRGRGDAIQKHLAQAIGKRLNNILDIEVYPSHSVNWNVLKLIKKGLVWDQGIELVEAEFTSLFLSMMAIFDRHPEYKVSSDFKTDSILHEGFLDLVKKQVQYTDDISDILITDKEITTEYAEQIISAKPKVVLLFDDVGAPFENKDNDYHKGTMSLVRNKIHVIPPFITTMGNSLIAEGLMTKKRNIEESFKLIQNQVPHFNISIWDYALNSRENYLTVASEIYNSMLKDSGKQTRFQIYPMDVGTMSYLA